MSEGAGPTHGVAYHQRALDEEILLVADDQGRYVDANEAAVAALGYSREELLELSVWDLTPGASELDGLHLWQQFIRAGRQEGEYVLTTKRGIRVRFRYRAVSDPQAHRHSSWLRRAPLE